MEQYYLPVKEIHSGLRWLILALIVIVIVKYLISWMQKKSFTSTDNLLGLILIIGVDLQFLLGLILYFFLSPVTLSAIQFGGYQLEDPNVRFYAIEHPVTMVLAVVFAHVGRVMSKKGTNETLRFKRGTLLFGISLLLMLARMPW